MLIFNSIQYEYRIEFIHLNSIFTEHLMLSCLLSTVLSNKYKVMNGKACFLLLSAVVL